MKKYLPASIVFALLLLGISVVFGQELTDTGTEVIVDTPSTYELIINDKIDTLQNYFALPELSSSTENISSPMPRFETQFKRDEFIMAYLIRIENEIAGLYRICER